MGANHEVNAPKINQNFPMGQHWLGKTKPKQAFRLTRNAFKKLLRNFLRKNNLMEFSTD